MNSVTIYQKPHEIRGEMAKESSVMAALVPSEKQVFLASTERPAADYNAAELAAELGKSLKWIAKDIGYRTDGSDLQYLTIRTAEIMKTHYGNLSLKDFRMAFELLLTGELDEYLPRGRDGQPERGHFQQFNAEYVCRVLNAYRVRRAAVLQKARKAMPVRKQERDPEAERRYLNETRRGLLQAFEEYKRNGYFPSISPIAEMLYYNLLNEVGLADPVEVSEEDEKEVLQKAIAYYAMKGQIGRVKEIKERRGEDLEYEKYEHTRRRVLKEAFRRMAERGVELNKYIVIDE